MVREEGSPHAQDVFLLMAQSAVLLVGQISKPQVLVAKAFPEACMCCLQAARLHPDAVDGDLVALQRRAQAAKAVSARASRLLLMPVQPQRPVPVEADAEEAHIKHMQLLIDGFADKTAAHNCVHLADGGSMLLPLQLKGLLW